MEDERKLTEEMQERLEDAETMALELKAEKDSEDGEEMELGKEGKKEVLGRR